MEEKEETSLPCLVYRGVNEIARAVGINPKRFTYYVRELELPAFKVDTNSKIWLAFDEDLLCWIKKRKEVYLKRIQQGEQDGD